MTVTSEIEKSREVLNYILADSELLAKVEHVAKVCELALRNGKKIIFAGNGGSAADSQHLAAELVGKLNFERPGLSAIALTTDTSAITAIGNDYGFEHVFSRQLAAMGQRGDVLVAISTSGNSENILKAIDIAKPGGIITVGMTGKTGGKMANMCDLIIKVPALGTQKIQECHIILGHIIAGLVEEKMFPR